MLPMKFQFQSRHNQRDHQNTRRDLVLEAFATGTLTPAALQAFEHIRTRDSRRQKKQRIPSDFSPVAVR